MSLAKPLSGKDVAKYVNSLYETRRELVSNLCKVYGNDKQVEQRFLKYIGEIDKLAESLDKKEDSGPGQTVMTTLKGGTSQTKGDKDAKKAENAKNAGKKYSLKSLVILVLALLVLWSLFKRQRKGNKNPARSIEEKTNMVNRIPFGKKKQPNQTGTIEETAKAPLVMAGPAEGEKEEEPAVSIEKAEGVDSQGQDNQEKTLEETPEEVLTDLTPDKGKCTAIDADNWIVVGASVQGNGHVTMDVPCQDNHAYEYLSDGWGIAITSDGAGSAKLSHKGSAAVVSRAMVHFKDLIVQQGWKDNNTLPSDGEWMKLSYKTLKLVHDEISALAKHVDCEPKDLSATIIVVVHSPKGLLVVHVGDGRAGYKDMEGNWRPLIVPHKGEEANQTIFLQSGFWNIPFYEMSGVTVPESLVLPVPVAAFTLMSDGCESTSWLCNQYNEDTGKYYDPNVPYAKFFDSLTDTLRSFREDQIPLAERSRKWYGFIKSGNKSLVKETDDKTMILAIRDAQTE